MLGACVEQSIGKELAGSSLAALQETTCQLSAQYFDKSLVPIKIIIMMIIITVAGSQTEQLSGGWGEQGCEILAVCVCLDPARWVWSMWLRMLGCRMCCSTDPHPLPELLVTGM